MNIFIFQRVSEGPRDFDAVNSVWPTWTGRWVLELCWRLQHGLAPLSPAREPRLFWSWAVVAVVFSPAGINYWLSVSRIFQMGCFLWNPKGESRSLGSGGREGRKLAKETVWKGCFPVSPNQVQNNKLSQSTFYLLTVRFSRPGQDCVRRATFATWLQQICLPDQSRG